MQTQRNTFAVKFYCRNSKANKQGQASLELSIIVNGVRVFITLPRKMTPKEFEKQTRARSSNETKQLLSMPAISKGHLYIVCKHHRRLILFFSACHACHYQAEQR